MGALRAPGRPGRRFMMHRFRLNRREITKGDVFGVSCGRSKAATRNLTLPEQKTPWRGSDFQRFAWFRRAQGSGFSQGGTPPTFVLLNENVFFSCSSMLCKAKRSVAQCRGRQQFDFCVFVFEKHRKFDRARVLSCELRGLGSSCGDQQT